jgi:hypothetical protein
MWTRNPAPAEGWNIVGERVVEKGRKEAASGAQKALRQVSA